MTTLSSRLEHGEPINWTVLELEWMMWWMPLQPYAHNVNVELDKFWKSQGGKERYFDLSGPKPIRRVRIWKQSQITNHKHNREDHISMRKVVRQEMPISTPVMHLKLGKTPRILMVNESVREFDGLVMHIEVEENTRAGMSHQVRIFVDGESIPDGFEFVTSVMTRNNIAYHIYWRTV